MQQISQQLQQVIQRVNQACDKVGRNPDEVQLLAVSKKQDCTAIRAAFEAGQCHFGENYVQEALEKMQKLSDLDIAWHLIGALQSNKTLEVAESFAWVHSVDRLKIAQRLSKQRPNHLVPLNICLQVNIDDQQSKSGCQLNEVESLVKEILLLPRLSLRGLMVIPQAGNHQAFEQLANLRQQLLATIPNLSAQVFDTLSMGMSDDLEQAIAAGSTMVRVGTAIFGKRLS
ncbi:MAG TPA: YggS family pyridoxal phosphate-dependent enzyme [Agitococcus sp.]|nr:YggS family pyridoxal phosphate-dependent enzyme [Agitococcus sp.]